MYWMTGVTNDRFEIFKAIRMGEEALTAWRPYQQSASIMMFLQFSQYLQQVIELPAS
jgi:hypothetical protein